MIENPIVAKQIRELMTNMFDRLCESCETVMENCSAEEHAAYVGTRSIGFDIVFDVMEPLYERNPGLKDGSQTDRVSSFLNC
jgi:hypothetical protein